MTLFYVYVPSKNSSGIENDSDENTLVGAENSIGESENYELNTGENGKETSEKPANNNAESSVT